MRLRLLFLLLILHLNSSFAQEWFKIYNDNDVKFTNKIFEDYDKGYLLSGHCFADPYHYYGLIMKIDINGNRLWTKYLGDENSWSALGGARIISDGGSIYSGGTFQHFNKMNPLVVKLNACGEKEWCKIYSSANPYAAADEIEIVPGGGYMLSVLNWLNQLDGDVWLFRLDSIGEIIWMQQFVADTAIYSGPNSRALIRTSDSCFLLNGYAWSPDSLYPNYKILKIFTIKCDLNGNAIFQEPWGNNDGLVSDYDHSNIEDKNHTYFVTGRLSTLQPPDSPAIFHITSTGKKDYYKILVPNTLTGGATTINRFQDSSLVISAGWSYGNTTDTLGIIKTTPVGDVIKKKSIVEQNPDASLWGATVTSDNKFIATGELNQMDAIVVKLNSELEYDSIYTQPLTYDSLCPHQIFTDTIPMNDCAVVTSVFDPVKNIEKTYLKVFPNPSSNIVHLEMPEYLLHKSKGYGFSANTFYYKWDKTKIVIYDLNGNAVHSENLLQKEKEITLDVKNWHDGMYVIRLLYLNDVVAQAKFLVQN